MAAVSFVHMTDLHVSHPDLGDEGVLTDTIATLRTVIGMVNGIAPRPSFVAISGDLTNRGDVESYRLLRGMMAELDLPLIYALGNHDTRPGFYDAMLDRADGPEAPYCHDRVIDGVHVVVLDTSVAGRIGGALCEAQFAFLEQAMWRHPGTAKIVVMHHAPALGDDFGHPWERLGEEDSARLLATLEGRDVAAILTGHIHHDRVSIWHGIPIVVGNGLHNFIDPLHRDGLRVMTGASLALCTLRPSGFSVSFVPLASDRRELGIVPDEQAKAFL